MPQEGEVTGKRSWDEPFWARSSLLPRVVLQGCSSGGSVAPLHVRRSVLKAMQGSMLDGHKLILQLCTAKSTAASTREKATEDESKTKLVVRNVAFEATRKDLSSLFSAVGQLKSVRLPKKFDGSHRGFAFVEYMTRQEAQSAIDTVAGTHLYGRRLVVERAKEGEGIEDLREKTAAKSRAGGDDLQLPPKRQRKGAGDSFEDLM